MEPEEGIFPISDVSRNDVPQRDMSRHTLTIKQAADLFASLSVPRSPRSVQRFCELKHLDCIRVQGDRTERYFIDPLSIERYAAELKQLESISRLGNDTLRHDTSLHDVTRHDATSITTPTIAVAGLESEPEAEKLRQRVDVLEKENLQLQIDRSAKEQVIGHMVTERRGLVEQLTSQSRVIGRLETQLLQLESPKSAEPHHDATEVIVAVRAPTEEERGLSVAEQITPTVLELNKPKRWWNR